MAKRFNASRSSSRSRGQSASRRLALLFTLASVGIGASEVRGDETDERWNLAGWTPFLSASIGVHAADVTGSVLATDSADNPIRTPDSNSDAVGTPMLRLSLGLESPELPEVPGQIRLFGTVDYFSTFPPDRNGAGEGDPEGFSIKPGFSNPPEQAIEGTGSKTSVRMGYSAYGATAGAVIPVEVAGFPFIVKPGVSWMRYKWDMKGLVLDAIKPPTLPGRDFRGVVLEGNGKLYSNGVGPYLAIEMLPDRFGPMLLSVFVEAAYYRRLGDGEADFTDSVTISGDGLPTETYLGRWGIELEDDFWRTAAGVRIFLARD